MEKRVGVLFIFLFIFTFVQVQSLEYLIYEEDFNELLEDNNEDCTFGSPGAYIGTSTIIGVCEEESYCEYEYTICENGLRVERQESKNCEPCQYGCYDYGCYNAKVSCSENESCTLKEGEIIDFEGEFAFGAIRIFPNGDNGYYLNINNHRKFPTGDRVNYKQELYTSFDFPYTYHITLTRTWEDHFDFLINKEKLECAKDNDCEPMTVTGCDNNVLKTTNITYYCSQNKCVKNNSTSDSISCEYKCENKSCVECEGCISEGECVPFGEINKSSICRVDGEIIAMENSEIEESPTVNTSASDSSSSTSKPKATIYIILAIVVLVLIIVALFFIFKKKQPENSVSESIPITNS